MFEQTSQELDAQSTGQVTVNVYDNQRLVYSTDLSTSLGLGRQRIGEPVPYCRITADNGDRLIIASVQEATISRDHRASQHPPRAGACPCTVRATGTHARNREVTS